MSPNSIPAKWTPYLLSVARIVVGFLVVWHGMIKLFGYPQGNAVALMSLTGIAGIVEFVGGLLMMFGLFTRPVAAVIAVEMAITYVTVNLPNGDVWYEHLLTLTNDGEPTLFYWFFFMFIAGAGGGFWGLDRLFSRKDAGGSVERISQYFASVKATYFLALMRIAIAFMFFQHGTQKVLGFPGGRPDHNYLTAIRPWGGLMEFIGSPLLALGIFVRPVSFLLSGEMAFAYWDRWAPRGFWPSIDRGEAAIYFCFTYLFLWAAGGGAWSLDNLLARRRARSGAAMDLEEGPLTKA